MPNKNQYPTPYTPDGTKKYCFNSDCLQNNPQPLGKFQSNGKGRLKARCKVCQKDYSKAYRKKHREQIRATSKRYREKHKHTEKYKQAQRRYAKKHKAKRSQHGHARRAKEAGNGGSYELDEWEQLLEYYNHKCLACGINKEDAIRGGLTVDHIIPIDKGGTNNITNLQPLCQSCNSSKGIKTTDYRPSIPDWIKLRTDPQFFDGERVQKAKQKRRKKQAGETKYVNINLIELRYHKDEDLCSIAIRGDNFVSLTRSPTIEGALQRILILLDL